jgi:multidrug resistance protein
MKLSSLVQHHVIKFKVAITLIAQLTLILYIPSLPAIAKDLHISAEASQFTYFICLFTFGCSQLFYGPLSDVLGRRPLILIGLFVCFLGNFIAIFSPNYLILIVARVLQGLGGGSALLLTRISLHDQLEKQQLFRAYSILSIALAVNVVFAPFLGGYIQYLMNWRTIFLVLSILDAAALILAFFCFPETNKKLTSSTLEEKKILTKCKHIVSNAQYLRASLLMICGYSAGILSLSMAPFIFQKVFFMPAHQFGILMILPGLGSFLGAIIAYRNKKKPLVIFSIISIFLGGFIILISNFLNLSSISETIFSITLVYFGWGMMSAKGFTYILSLFPTMNGMAAGLFSFFRIIGASLISTFVSFFHGVSLLILGYSILIFSVLMFLILLWIKKASDHSYKKKYL